MSKSSWESSRNQASNLRLAVVILPVVFFVMIAALAPPLSAKLSHHPLAAEQASSTKTLAANSTQFGISGQIVDSATGAAISGGQVIVALEQPDGTGTDVVFMQTTPDSSGHFAFNPLPLGATFDLVAVATSGSGVAYDATVALAVPPDADLGAIPLVAENGDSSGPARIEGIVMATSGTGPSSVRVTISAVQAIDLSGGLSLPVDVPLTVTIAGANRRPVTIPGERGTSADILVKSDSDCPASAAPNFNCGHYVIAVPGSNPSVGIFQQGKISYRSPAAGPAQYSLRANSYMPYAVGAGVCIPSFLSAGADAQGRPIKLSPDGTATAQPLAFTACW
jgi:hypothetical protein